MNPIIESKEWTVETDESVNTEYWTNPDGTLAVWMQHPAPGNNLGEETYRVSLYRLQAHPRHPGECHPYPHVIEEVDRVEGKKLAEKWIADPRHWDGGAGAGVPPDGSTPSKGNRGRIPSKPEREAGSAAPPWADTTESDESDEEVPWADSDDAGESDEGEDTPPWLEDAEESAEEPEEVTDKPPWA